MLGVSVLCLMFFVVTLSRGETEPQALRPSASDFKKYTLVQPRLQHGRTKRHISTTRDTSGTFHSDVIMKIPIDDEELILDLQLNQDLLTDDHVLTYQKNGETVVHRPKREEIDLCHYGGSVRDKPGSWVAVSTCNGVQGVVFDGTAMRYIEPAQGGDITSQHFVYDHSDLSVAKRCGNDASMSKGPRLFSQIQQSQNRKQKSKLSRHKRRAPDTQLHAPYNANENSRYVELVLVADNSQFNANGRSMNAVYREMKTLANIVNSVYSPLNIFIALVGVVVWNDNDKIWLSSNSSITLANFIDYRKQELLKHMPNDNAHLITGQGFEKNVIGKAYTSAMCNSGTSGGVSTKHTEVLGLQAMTMAHEMGHNFGMDHDDENCGCPDKKCIMSATSSSIAPSHWSTCSLQAVTYSFSSGLDYCLRNKPTRLFDSQRSPMCGNGFVEEGEQCDCGKMVDWYERNPCHACCDPSTCMLRANATCGAGECCDLQTCHPKSAGTLCRSAGRECDLPEFCTGQSEFCPDDLHKMDSMPCGIGEESAYCVRGQCHSHTSQCRLLWGETGNNSELCYNSNTAGNELQNCGYDIILGWGEPCASRDVRCGRLHCTYLGTGIKFAKSFATTGTGSITSYDTVMMCYTARISMGLNEDPGMVPDGAKCGEQMMCWNKKCVSVANVRNMITNGKSSVCPSDCSGHGVCNSKGECHCEPGFAPPLCIEPGTGGSLSSGPATNPAIQRNLMVALYAIFLGIVPFILLILFLIYYFRPDMFSRCDNCVQVLTCNKYFKKCIPKRQSRLSKCTNTELPRKSQQRPDIVHHVDYEKLHQLPNNTCVGVHSESKSTSVIYANFISIREQNSNVSSHNDNLQHSTKMYENVDFNKTGQASKALLDCNIKSDSNDKVNLTYTKLDKVVGVNCPSNDSLSKVPAKVASPASQNLPDNPPITKILNNPRKHTKVPGNNLRKAPAPIVSSPNDPPKNILENSSDKPINSTNIKLRKVHVNKDQSPNSRHNTENKIDMFNVKLRKTPGKLVGASNVDKSFDLLDKSKNETQSSKPIKKIKPINTQIENNKDLNVKVSPSGNSKKNVHNSSN